MNKETLTQCRLTKDRGNNTFSTDVRWIPTKYAVRGSYIKRQINGEWEDGWLVTEVFATFNSTNVLSRERDFMSQRKASDI